MKIPSLAALALLASSCAADGTLDLRPSYIEIHGFVSHQSERRWDDLSLRGNSLGVTLGFLLNRPAPVAVPVLYATGLGRSGLVPYTAARRVNVEPDVDVAEDAEADRDVAPPVLQAQPPLPQPTSSTTGADRCAVMYEDEGATAFVGPPPTPATTSGPPPPPEQTSPVAPVTTPRSGEPAEPGTEPDEPIWWEDPKAIAAILSGLGLMVLGFIKRELISGGAAWLMKRDSRNPGAGGDG